MLDLIEIACPNCLSSIELEFNNHGSTVRCEACHSNFLLEGHLCHYCHAFYKNDVDLCGKCGTKMMRTCGKCQTSNWAGEEYCKSCGVSMDLMDVSIQRYHEESALFREAKLEQVREVRAQQAAESAKRMARFEQMEVERRKRLLEQEKGQQRRDRLKMIGTVFYVTALILVVIVIRIIF